MGRENATAPRALRRLWRGALSVGAEISGRLQCEGGVFSNPEGWALFFSRANIEGGAYLGQDEKRPGSKAFEAFGQVRFRGIEIGGNLECQKGRIVSKVDNKSLLCDGSKITGHVKLCDGFSATGEVDFLGADIGGEVKCEGGRFTNPQDVALCFSNAKITGSMHLSSMHLKSDFRAYGEVRMDGAIIGGSLKCEKGHFCNPDTRLKPIFSDPADEESRALYFSGAKISGSVLLNGAQALGQVRFRNAVIGGTLECDEASFASARDGYRALLFDHAKVGGTMRMRKLRTLGQVRFTSAEAGGDLRLEGANLRHQKDGNNPNQDMGDLALFFSRAKIEGSVYLNRGFYADGEVRFRSAYIGGTLVCDGASLRSHSGKEPVALFFNNARIAGNATFNMDNKRFEAVGKVCLAGAQIDGKIECKGAHFSVLKGEALVVTNTKVGGHVLLTDGFRSKGSVNFDHASVDGNVDCYGGTFQSINIDDAAPGKGTDALTLRSAVIKNSLRLYQETIPPAMIEGVLDLRGAKVAALVDHAESWPGKGNLKLDGLIYNRFAESAPYKASERKDWLKRQPDDDLRKNFKPQPFEQLVKVLKEAGHGSEAKGIAIEEQQRLTRRARLQWHIVSWLWRSFLNASMRYGYVPQIIFVATIAVWLACGFIYKQAQDQKLFAPTMAGYFLHEDMNACRATEKVSNNRAGCYSENGPEYVAFDPYMFSLDVILPIVNLRQEDAWQPMPRPLELRIGGYLFPLPFPIRLVTWFETLFGWLAAIMLTAYIGGVIKKE